MFRFFRISPSFIFHFRFISGIFRRSYFIISGLLCICEMFRLVSISLPSPSLPDVRSFLCCMFPYFRKFPSCISHHFRFKSGLFRRHIFGSFRPSYFIFSASFPDYSVVIFQEIPSFIFHHFRFISGLFRRHISGSFRSSYFIISTSFPDYCVVIFPEISVLHISSFPLHFRITSSSYFRKFPSFIFHHVHFISGLFRCLVSGSFRPSYFIISVSFPDYSVLAVRVIFDLGLFCLETETQQYVLLGTKHRKDEEYETRKTKNIP